MTGRLARLHLGLALGLLGSAPALAASTPRLAAQDLATVELAPPPDARLPTGLDVTDVLTGRATTLGAAMAGRPTLFLPVDYECRTLCDPVARVAADALAATGLGAAQARVVLLGLDPATDPAVARRFAEEAFPPDARPSLVALVGGDPAIRAATASVGYRYAYDAPTRTYAHPAGAVMLTADGRVARVLSSLALDGPDLRRAFVEAGEGRVGTLADRIALLCYGFDPALGIYTPAIRRLLAAAAAATLVVCGIAFAVLVRRTRRQPA